VKCIIFLPVGRPIEVHGEGVHWRYSDGSVYEVALARYKDFDPEPNSYQYLLDYRRNEKWVMVKQFLDNFDYSNYDYISFFDDDIWMSQDDLTSMLQFARNHNMKIFQPSLREASKSNHPITNQDKNLLYTRTNFVECMCPFFHISVIEKFKKLWDYHVFFSGWGLDCILHDALKEDCYIIHKYSMYHKPAASTFDRRQAHMEM